LRKAKNIKTSLAPVNNLAPEILALVAGFLEPGRPLINATAVCQHWRTTLLSFPRLWSRIRSSDGALFEAYLKRSKSVPLKVRVLTPDLRIFKLLVPHTSRLTSLAMWMEDSREFQTIAHHPQNSFPALRKFSVIKAPGVDFLELPSGTDNSYFPHLKKLHMEAMFSLRVPHPFPHVTELKWVVKSYEMGSVAQFLDIMEKLPLLERVEAVLGTNQQYTRDDEAPHVITLPHLQWMSLHCSQEIPPILRSLKLPKLTSLVVDGRIAVSRTRPILPTTSFDEHLPNFTELPEMEVCVRAESSRVTFRASSQATLEHSLLTQPVGKTPYRNDRHLWGCLPLHSVRKLIVIMDRSGVGVADVWLIHLLRDVGSLEHLELWGCCGELIRYLRQRVMRGDHLPGIKTLTVYSGYRYVVRQALKLENVMDQLGLGISVTCIQDPEMTDDGQ
jgi:hypothetical protein